MKRQMRSGVGVAASLVLMGCAPESFGPAVGYYTDSHHVRDGAARRVRGHWHLRFNEWLLSDLDEAIHESDDAALRRRTDEVLDAAHVFGERSAGNEIDRLPGPGREQLGRRAGTDSTSEALKAHYASRANEAAATLQAELASLSPSGVRQRLRHIRRRVEPARDDRGRLSRQLTFAFGALPAWIAVGAIEKQLDRDRPAKVSKVFEQAVSWTSARTEDDDPLVRFAPTVVVEWPADRTYPIEMDRIGFVHLAGTPSDVNVNVDTSRPVIYTYTAQAKIHGRRYAQLVYTWWFPRHPEMTKNDPAAGHIDGNTFRITLDQQGRPAIFEVVQNCGCNHVVFVARHVEKAAQRAFGEPLRGKHFVVEADVRGKRDLHVVGLFELPPASPRPIVHILAGVHEPGRVECTTSGQPANLRIAEEQPYETIEYETLERLPLGDGVASMFDSDGLVHKAARFEGMLLTPTGILSAGQPRKRGTQRILWDDHRFDDPHLLERALRLPPDF